MYCTRPLERYMMLAIDRENWQKSTETAEIDGILVVLPLTSQLG
jgi:hypothetical protein